MGSELELVYNRYDIQEGIVNLSNQLKLDYSAKQVIIISILKGAILFTSDLIKHLGFDVNYELHFCKCTSYTKQEKGTMRVEMPVVDYINKHVLILDDIHDTGETINTVKQRIIGATSIKTSVVINKDKENKEDHPDYYLIDYKGNDWFVGYGMDLNEKHRGLEAIYRFTGNKD